MKHSAIYPGKYFAMCKVEKNNETDDSMSKAERLDSLAKAMRSFAKQVKYNASLKIAVEERAEYDLARIQERAAEVKKMARNQQNDAAQTEESAKIIAFQADVAAKKQVAQLDKDLQKIAKNEAEEAMDAHDLRLNVTRTQAKAESARQQASLVNMQATKKMETAHKTAADKARRA